MAVLPYLAERVYIPREFLTHAELQHIQERLTVRPHHFKTFSPEPPDPIPNYGLSDTYVALPVYYGLCAFSDQLDIVDRTSTGYPIKCPSLPDPSHPRASPNQREFMEQLLVGLGEYHIILAEAPTGSGKTCCALYAAAKLAVTTLVIVPTANLAEQWVAEIKDKLGVPEDKIAIVRQGKCDYEGKWFCVSVINSAAKNKYTKDYYRYFGLVIWDEVHVAGAKFFSKSLGLYRAKYRLALTATVERPDKCHTIYLDYFGPPLVKGQAQPLPCEVLVIPYAAAWDKKEFYTQDDITRKLIYDKIRNDLIVNTIGDAIEDGRNILVIGDSIDHLEALYARVDAMCEGAVKLGLFTGQRNLNGKRVATKQQELQRVKEEAKVIFATYGMMKQGIDIPRLDFGIDVTPKSQATQVIGRIRRPVPGKKTPVWVTILDKNNKALCSRFKKRLEQYKKTNCTVKVIK